MRLRTTVIDEPRAKKEQLVNEGHREFRMPGAVFLAYNHDLEITEILREAL
jgi:hypothetical protein